MTAIRAIGLTKRYGAKAAVKGLELSIDEGELFALLGLNGAGKTTTIKMPCCLTRPSEGDAVLLGHSVVTEPQEVKQLINISPQETAVAPNLTVRENLQLIAGLYGSTFRQARQQADATIDGFGMAEIARDRAKTLSGGWQRRLSIAMALISRPRVLFLDEPTLGLDVLARRELWTVIRGLKDAVTIMLTTHYMEEAEALSDRIGVMARGDLRAVGTADELKATANATTFEDAFVALAAGEATPQ